MALYLFTSDKSFVLQIIRGTITDDMVLWAEASQPAKHTSICPAIIAELTNVTNRHTDTLTDHATPSVKKQAASSCCCCDTANSLLSTLLPNGNNFEATVDFVRAIFQCFSVGRTTTPFQKLSFLVGDLCPGPSSNTWFRRAHPSPPFNRHFNRQSCFCRTIANVTNRKSRI